MCLSCAPDEWKGRERSTIWLVVLDKYIHMYMRMSVRCDSESRIDLRAAGTASQLE